MRLPLALLLGAAYALHPPPTNGLRKRNLYRTQTQYKTDSADGAGSFDRAVDALRAKGDAAAVKALQADVADIVVKIDGHDVDVTDYAREHPGGAAVLRKFHGRDASKAFHAAKHSKAALDRMKALQPEAKAKTVSRASKLFTHEDRSQVHKVLGLWCLGHYVVRIHRGIWSADPTGGLRGPNALLWVLPHALLSLSSIKFHVPRERVAKKPMIWQEFRAHNIIFALRSFACAALAAASLDASTVTRERAALGASTAVLASLIAADVATARLREDSSETTTGTMPYWAGASPATIGRFKYFYVRRGVPGIFVDSSLDSSIARRHAIAAASSQCLIRAGTSASARRAPARRTPARCVGGPSRTCSACSCLDFLHHYRCRRRSAALIYI